MVFYCCGSTLCWLAVELLSCWDDPTTVAVVFEKPRFNFSASCLKKASSCAWKDPTRLQNLGSSRVDCLARVSHRRRLNSFCDSADIADMMRSRSSRVDGELKVKDFCDIWSGMIDDVWVLRSSARSVNVVDEERGWEDQWQLNQSPLAIKRSSAFKTIDCERMCATYSSDRYAQDSAHGDPLSAKGLHILLLLVFPKTYCCWNSNYQLKVLSWWAPWVLIPVSSDMSLKLFRPANIVRS